MLAGAIGIFMMKNAFRGNPAGLCSTPRASTAHRSCNIFFRIMLHDGAATDRRADHPDDGDDLEQFPVAERRAHQERAGCRWPWASSSCRARSAAPHRVIAVGAVLTVAPALIVFFFTQRFFMRGMEGAIK